MQTLFELNEEQDRLMALLCDEETGEINEEVYEQLEALEMDRAEKIDGWCFWIKQRKAELEGMKKVLEDATAKYKAAENQLNRTRERFAILMNGEKFKSSWNSVYYRTSESVEMDDGKSVYDIEDDFLTYAEPKLNKTKIKAALALGIEIPGVHLAESTSMIVR